MKVQKELILAYIQSLAQCYGTTLTGSVAELPTEFFCAQATTASSVQNPNTKETLIE